MALAQAYASEYLKSKGKSATSYDDQAAAYERLMGKAYNPLKDDFNAGAWKNLGNDDLTAYRNLFEPVTAGGGFRGGTPTGEYKLKADKAGKGFGAGFAQTNAQKELQLRQQLMGSAYEDALTKNLFTQSRDITAEKLKELGDAGFSKEGIQQYWTKLHNNLTGEDQYAKDYDREEESNFYRRYKKQIIQGGAGVLGFALGGPAGALLAAQLAGTARDIYEARKNRREAIDEKRDFENATLQAEALYGPHGANLFRGAGEGVVDWSTSDVDRNKRKDTYVRNAT